MIVTVSIEIDFEPSDGETAHLGTRKVEQTVRHDGWQAVGIGISDTLTLARVPRDSETLAELVRSQLFERGDADYSSISPEANDKIHEGRQMMLDGANKVVAGFKKLDQVVLDS